MNIFYVAKSIFCKTCSSWIFLQQLLNNFLTCKPSVHNTHYVLVKSLEFQSISELGMHHIFCLCQLQCSPTSSSQSHAMALAPLQLFRSYSAFDAKKPKKKRAKGWKGIKIGEKSAIFLLTPLSTGTQFVPCSHTAPICSTFSSRHSSHRGRVFTFGPLAAPLAPMARWREKGKTNKNLKACN